MEQSLKVLKEFNRIAGMYDLLTNGSEKRRFSSWHENFISPLNGTILEIGIESGKVLNTTTTFAK